MPAYADGAVTTIAVAGFPVDASLRELKNLCRSCDGFEMASPNVRPGKPPTLFVKFDSTENAAGAIAFLRTLIFDEEAPVPCFLKAEFAKKEMGLQEPSLEGGQLKRPLSHEIGHVDVGEPLRKRVAAAAPSVTPLDTVACKVLENTAEETQQFFEQLPGFVAFKLNSNGRNCFVKFADCTWAESGLVAAQQAGFTLDFAKRPLLETDFAGSDVARVNDGEDQIPVGMDRPIGPGSISHSQVAVGGADTLACKIGSAGEEALAQFFEPLPGFQTMKFAHRVGACFLKFQDYAHAWSALTAARENGFTLDFAKRSLGPEEGAIESCMTQLPAQSPAWTSSVAPNTLACKIDSHGEEGITMFFEALSGFQAVKFNHKANGSFVKFVDHDSAWQALTAAREVGLTIDFARRNLTEEDMETVLVQPVQVPLPQTFSSPLVSGSPLDVSTLAVKIESRSQEDIAAFFEVLPGYQSLRYNRKSNGCFVKFDDPEQAWHALNIASGSGFTLDFAKRDLNSDDLSVVDMKSEIRPVPAPAVARQPLVTQVQSNTLACKIDPLGEVAINTFFERCAGFQVLRYNYRSGGCFVKFVDHTRAKQALVAARSAGFVLDFARRNLTEEDIVAVPAVQQPPPSQVSSVGVGGDIDTLAVKFDANTNSSTSAAVLENLPGFQAMKLFPKSNGCFVKFMDPGLAHRALVIAREAGLTLDFAKRNLVDEDLICREPEPTQVVPPPMPQSSGDVDTLALKAEGLDEEILVQFFESLPGFQAMKLNQKVKVCFLKFMDPALARHALVAARDAGFTVDMAKHSMEITLGRPANQWRV